MQLDFPSIFRAIGDCERPAGRGDEGKPAPDPDAHFFNETLEAVRQAWAAYQGVQSPASRGQLVAQMREVLREMERAGYVEEDSDF